MFLLFTGFFLSGCPAGKNVRGIPDKTLGSKVSVDGTWGTESDGTEQTGDNAVKKIGNQSVSISSAVPEHETALSDASSGGLVKNIDESFSFSSSSSSDSPSSKKVSDTSPYNGEKITLDFFQTDIRNVFRILRRVSKMNFAVDQDVQGTVTMTLEHPVPWDQVLDLVLRMNHLAKKQEGEVIRICTLETLQTEEKEYQKLVEEQKNLLTRRQQLAPLQTIYIPVNYSDAEKEIIPHIKVLLTKDRGVVSVDTRTNTIIATDTVEVLDRVRKMVFRLDRVTPQILIEAKVVEVTKKFSRSIGVGWNLSNSPEIMQGFVDDFHVAVNRSLGQKGIGGDFAFYHLAGHSSALNARLEASEQQGDVRIISSPRILTLDNKKARIKQGLEYAYLERDDSGGSSVKFKDIDLLLEVTPHVISDGRVAMSVKLTKNDIADKTVGGAPILTTNEAQTELLVDNKKTIVIGGIVKTSRARKNAGVPFLSSLPLLGNLFGTREKADDRNELLIFMTPTIVQLKQRHHSMGSFE